jgi:hypothetical protein
VRGDFGERVFVQLAGVGHCGLSETLCLHRDVDVTERAHEGGGGHALVEVDWAVCEEGGVEACVSGDGSDSVVLLGHASL